MAIGEKIDYKVFFTVLKFTYTREELLSFVGLKTSRKLVVFIKLNVKALCLYDFR